MKYGDHCKKCETGFYTNSKYNPDSKLFDLHCDICGDKITLDKKEKIKYFDVMEFMQNLSIKDLIIVFLIILLCALVMLYYSGISSCNAYYADLLKDCTYILQYR